jgi:hypothetical protein
MSPECALTRGQHYTLPAPDACVYCGERKMRYLLQLRSRPLDATEPRVSRFVFQCLACHSARTVRFRDTP